MPTEGALLSYFANLGTRDKVYLGVAAPLALLVVIGVIGIYSVNTITATNQRLETLEAVLKDAASITAAAVDMESGMRGYLLAGQEELLEPYQRGSATTFRRIDALKERVSRNPQQAGRLEGAASVLRDWQAEVVEPAIALRREIGDSETMNDMARLVAKGEGKQYFDRFRGQIGRIVSAEQELLERRRREFREARNAIDDGLLVLSQTQKAVQHTGSMIAEANRLLAQALGMETVVRGYMLAGEAEFLEPFEHNHNTFFASLFALQGRFGDNAEQAERLNKIEGLMRWWVSQVAEPAVELRQRVNAGDRSLLHLDVFVSRQQGKLAFDGVRETMTEFIVAERQMMRDRLREAEQSDTLISTAVETMLRNEEDLAKTHQAIAAVNDLIVAAVDMESGMRGFLLTGRNDYLEPYHAGAQTFSTGIAQLHDLVSGSADQAELVTQAEQTIRDWQSRVVEPQLELRRKIGDAKTMDDMADLVAESRGKEYFDRFRTLMGEFTTAGEGHAEAYRIGNADTVARSRYAMTAVALIAIISGFLLAWVTGNGIAGPLSKMTDVTGRLAAGDMEIIIPGGGRSDEIGEMARALEKIRAVGVMAAQTQSSLNDASSPMMIVNWEGRIIFANKAVVSLFEALRDDLAGELSGFAGEVLAGSDFNLLHNLDVMHSARLMEQDKPITARMTVNGRSLELTASPVYNDMHERLGAVIEWQDMTGQVAVEREIAGLVRMATQGDFSTRLSEADKTGFMAELANGVNELIDVVDNGLNQVVRVVSALATGDLTKRMNGVHAGAFGRLKEDVDRMAGQMEDMLGRIAEASDAVKGATDEISSGIVDLSGRTEHQASSLEETTASMEQLSATVRRNADNAHEANQVASAAREAAASGGEVTGRAVQAMGLIEESSKSITDIVGLMQEIAFQTNLLALNASVEAARAGDAGRGFAVVASEVRALSQRSAQASKDIRELITNSDNQVREGVKLVAEVGAALEVIVNSVKTVADHVSEIAAASQQQTGGIEQVSGAIVAMDEMTQQNASLVEEANASIRAAAAQITDLQDAIGFFKTARDAQARPDEAPAAASGAEQLREIAGKMADAAAGPDADDDAWEVF